MKIGNGFLGMNASARGLSIHRKKMNIIAENIASADNVRTPDGKPYRRKFLSVIKKQVFNLAPFAEQNNSIRLNTTNKDHIQSSNFSESQVNGDQNDVSMDVVSDNSEGDWVYMPDHPDANEEGYVQQSNVNIINEMVDMIAATRSYEANLTAFNASKQMAKESLDI